MISCNVIVAAALLVQEGAHEHRRSCSSSRIFVNIGMWFERFVIIVTSLHRDFLPSCWGYFRPTIWDVACLLGQLRPVLHAVLLFVRFLPMVAIAEVKAVLPQADPHHAPGRRAGARRAGQPDALLAGAARSALRRARRVRRARRSSTAPASACATPATRAGTRTRRSRCTASTRAMGLGRSRLPWIVLVLGARRAPRRLRAADLGARASPTRS